MGQAHIFETSNVDFAAFLMLEGIKYLECRKDRNSSGRDIAIMRFVDEKQNCLDLERVFLSSDHKKYREFHKYLLREVHSKVK